MHPRHILVLFDCHFSIGLFLPSLKKFIERNRVIVEIGIIVDVVVGAVESS
jgi:hypothetical protein